ncbi:MAG: hypothetical protein AAGD14_03250, partial [Planctomycetota bacterium]
RARTAIALSDGGRHREAITHFRLLRDYRGRTMGTQAHLDGADLVSISPPTWLAAAHSLESTGNPAHAWAWLQQAAQYFERSQAGHGDVLKPQYEAYKRRLTRPAGVRDQTLSQMGSEVFRDARVSQPSQSVDGRRQQAASFVRYVEQQHQRIARLPEAQRAAEREKLARYVARNAPPPIIGAGRRGRR